MAERIMNCVCELREKGNVTQEDLADSVGVSRQTIISLEKGNYIPSLLLAMKIAKFFKKTVEQVFFLKK